ncbi:hypothetical protein D3C73_894000 [compost metagenome]
MHRVTGLDQLDDFLGVAVDQGDLAVVAQGHREQVRQIEFTQLFLRTILRLDQYFPGLERLGHAPFRRGRRRVLDELGHGGDLLLGQGIGGAPVRHACGRSVGDQRL